jgi:8-oxo-dGTP diphosphatase
MVVVRGQMSNIVPLGAAFRPPFDKVTSVGVVPFTDDGLIVAALLQRGVDLPGDHVQEGERTIEEVARREALEEAGITLREVHVAEVLQSDYYGPDDLTYMVLTTAFVDEYRPFAPNEESQR